MAVERKRGPRSLTWRVETALGHWVASRACPSLSAWRGGGGLEEPQAPTGDRRFLWASSFSSALPSGLEKVVENALFSLSLGD